MHAATLVAPGSDKALAICGRSGAGKSSLAAELSRRGWTLVADDTTRVTWDGENAIAWPSRDSIKLWKDACESAGIDTATLKHVMKGMDKFYVHVAARDQPIKLGTIVELSPDGASRVQSAGDRMALVSRHAYRSNHIRPLGMQREHVQIVARVASACAMYKLPGERAMTVAALADPVERTLV